MYPRSGTYNNRERIHQDDQGSRNRDRDYQRNRINEFEREYYREFFSDPGRQDYRDPKLQDYRDPKLHDYREPKLQDYRNPKLQDYRDRGRQNHGNFVGRDYEDRQKQDFRDCGRQEYGHRGRRDYVDRGRQDYGDCGRQDYGDRNRNNFEDRSRQDFGDRSRQDFGECNKQDFRDRNRQDFGDHGRQNFRDRGRQNFGGRGRPDNGNRGRQDYGDRGRQDYGDRGRQDYGDRGRQDFGDHGRQDYGDHGRQNYGDRGRQNYGDHGRPDNGNRGRQDYGDRGRQDYGDRGRQDYGDRGRQDYGDRGRQNYGDRGRQNYGDSNRQGRGGRHFSDGDGIEECRRHDFRDNGNQDLRDQRPQQYNRGSSDQKTQPRSLQDDLEERNRQIQVNSRGNSHRGRQRNQFSGGRGRRKDHARGHGLRRSSSQVSVDDISGTESLVSSCSSQVLIDWDNDVDTVDVEQNEQKCEPELEFQPMTKELQHVSEKNQSEDVEVPIEPLHINKLFSLLQCNPDQVIFHLIQPHLGLKERLDLPRMQLDYLSVLLKILTLSFKATMGKGSQNCLMEILLKSNFFTNHLSALFSVKNNPEIFDSLCLLLTAIIERMPGTVADELEGSVRMCAAAAMEYNNPQKSVKPETLKQLKNIEAEVEAIIKTRNKILFDEQRAKLKLSDIDDETPEDYPVNPNEVEVTRKSDFSDDHDQFQENLNRQLPSNSTTKTINILLPCGHGYPILLDPPRCLSDIDRETYKCQKKCQKVVCARNHKCKNLCHQPCNECEILVEKELQCGHTKLHPCSKSLSSQNDQFCDKKCERVLPCRHPCKLSCSTPCGNCAEVVEKHLPCGHTTYVACYQSASTLQCNNICDALLPCGHLCELPCSVPCGKCSKLIEKTLQCGHKMTASCHVDISTLKCSKPCRTMLPCGHTCSQPCGTPCAKTCGVLIKELAKCGHEVEVTCLYKQESADFLDKECHYPCNQQLPCGHNCTGTCSECRQGRFHIPCKTKCNQTLICGHLCDFPCSSGCPPCKRECPMQCKHSRCSKKCGQQCLKCYESCDWKCRHYQCSMLCFEKCNRPRCDEPCRERLPCGHLCIGLCGETCPKLCRFCNHQELTDFILSGFEDDPDARFVQLSDCKHCIEVRGLDRWMEKSPTKIQLKCCPICTTPIRLNYRYSNIIKGCMDDIEQVKQRIYGTDKSLYLQRQHLFDLFDNEQTIMLHFQAKTLLLMERLSGNDIYSEKLATIDNQVNLLKMMVSVKVKAQETIQSVEAVQFLEKELLILAERLLMNKEKITGWEVQAIASELNRTELWMRFKDIIATAEMDGFPITNHLSEAKRLLLMGRSTLSSTSTQTVLNVLKKASGNLNLKLTNAERLQIIMAMNLGKGHWYKCPNGHIYCIGDKGTPMVVGRCYDCCVQIGGTSGNLLANNTVAIEMENLLSIGKVTTRTEPILPTSFIRSLDETSRIKYPPSRQTVQKPPSNSTISTTSSGYLNLGVSDYDRQMIVNAMALKSGHWYKCPNGHYYAIGETGGAGETSTCPECSAPIGGTNQILAKGNAHAPEVDGSRFPALTEVDCLENYDLEDLE